MTTNRPWPRNPQYLVSDDGRVIGPSGRRLCAFRRSASSPYLSVNVTCSDNAYGFRTVKVHTMVLETFVGPRPEGMQCRHVNGDSFDNRLSNLRWGSPQENGADKSMHGRSKGERHHNAVLTTAEVQAIKSRLSAGTSGAELARVFGVSVSTVSKIKLGHYWRHVETY